MAVCEPKGSGKWCYKFVWRGVTIRESTRNKGVAGVPAVSSGEVGCHNGWGNCHLRLRAQKDGLEVSSINRELQVLRPLFPLAPEWEKMTRVFPGRPLRRSRFSRLQPGGGGAAWPGGGRVRRMP